MPSSNLEPRTACRATPRPLIVDNPYSGEVHCAVRYHSDAEVGAIVDKAAQQQRSWRDVPLGQRLDVVNKCGVCSAIRCYIGHFA
jgi:acyl-CoA reductase-like NAD-dependent aldehyde dehydrogenase